jgi:hypothetical protein
MWTVTCHVWSILIIVLVTNDLKVHIPGLKMKNWKQKTWCNIKNKNVDNKFSAHNMDSKYPTATI